MSALLDVPFDAALVLLSAGLVGPIGDRADELAAVGRLAVARRERLILEKLVESARATAGPAVMIAALFEGENPNVLIRRAVTRFRCISWERLYQQPEIIVGGGTLDGQRAPAELYHMSEQCRAGECDFFFSHSWHDDAHLKWEALSDSCSEFKNECQRSPRLWLDKVCIDQADVSADLQCLPICLAACERPLIISGMTYTQRLWCCVELFVYVQMSAVDETVCPTILHEDEIRKLPIVVTIGSDDEEHARVRMSWIDFDASNCRCAGS